jgi:F-type H+-transporting ATPase subunit c
VKKRIFLIAILLIAIAAALPVFAQEGGAAPSSGWTPATVKIFTAGFAMAFASALCGIGQGIGISAACKGAARNPAIAGKIQMMMIIGLVFIESLVLYTLLIVFVKV